MNNVVSMMISADWHIGATNPIRFREELLRTFKSKLDTLSGLDVFFVAGDTFDMKEYLSSEVVTTYLLIMKDLLKLTEKFGTMFYIIEGTRTHDAMQLDTLEVIFNDICECDRITFIKEVTNMNICGMEVLFIPEEYLIDQDAYYEEYFKKHYDLIIGHGMTDMMWYAKPSKDKTQSTAPVFKVDDLCKIANYSYFGHVHFPMHGGKNNRFLSLGPVTRWEFDKDKPCGMYYIEYDKASGIAFEEFVENIYAPYMPTVSITINENIDIEALNKNIRNKLVKVQDNADKTRLIVAIDSTIENYLMIRDFILASFGNIKNLKLVMKIDEFNDVEETKDDTPKSVEQLVELKPYLYDKSMGDDSRISAFIQKKNGVNIPLENILEVISPKTTKII